MNIDPAWMRRGANARRAAAAACVIACALIAGCAKDASAAAEADELAPGSDSTPHAAFAVSPEADARIGPDNDFDPEVQQQTYTLHNSGTAPLQWSALASESWLSLNGPTSGVLPPDAAVELSVSVDSFAAGQAAGREHADGHVDFFDSATGASLAVRHVTVQSSFSGAFGATPSAASSSPDQDAAAQSGWTVFTPSADTRKVYVSSAAGDDGFSGLSPSQAKRTLAAGKSLLRHGFPDWLLLKRGDVWHESFGQWKCSGRSPLEPMLVATYGSASARPLLLTGPLGGLWTEGGSQSPAHIDNLALVGLHMRPEGFGGWGDCVGVRMLQPGSHFLIEDCKFEAYSTNLVFQGFGGQHYNFRLRRSVIADAYSIHGSGAHPQGLYAYAVNGLLIEECLFDHNGWNSSVSGAGADMFSHNVYIDNGNTGVVVRGNIIANASSHGMQLRPGGLVLNNLFVRNSIALSVGGGNNPEPAGVQADILGNVILDGKDIDSNNARGWALWLANIAKGNVLFNVVANNTLGTQPTFVTLDGDHVGDSQPSIGVHELAIAANVFHDWGGGMVVEGAVGQITKVHMLANDVQDLVYPYTLLDHVVPNSTLGFDASGNRFFAAQLPVNSWTLIGNTAHAISDWMTQVGDSTSVIHKALYKDPKRSPASYNASLGGSSSLDAFLAKARQQSVANWNPDYLAVQVNRYVRTGFHPLGP
jgi:hypothetical protein